MTGQCRIGQGRAGQDRTAVIRKDRLRLACRRVGLYVVV